jgi:FKBP-type peptidyl-prolyl cis-trans isomerase FkpA
MKAILILTSILYCITVTAAEKDSIRTWQIEDSVKGLSVYSEVSFVQNTGEVKTGYAWISADGVSLTLQKEKRNGIIVIMTTPMNSKVVASGLNVHRNKSSITFRAAGPDTGTYKLMLVKAFDSAANFSLLSGYVFLPQLQQWKLIGTTQYKGYGYLHDLNTATSTARKKITYNFMHIAVLGGSGKWRTIEGSPITIPTINWFNEPDSAQRASMEKTMIESTVAAKEQVTVQPHAGLYYSIEKMGTGKMVKVTDTVTVYYKGHVFGDTTNFDQTAEGKPARFPLARLIRGWQIGLPLIKEGGKIRLIIPSGLAYSIRTRSPKIPPTSVLVFDIEVVKAE